MKTIALPSALGLLLALCLYATPVAAATVAVVSANGNDANPCTVAAPCRTFDRAHTVVASGGSIYCADSGYFGTAIITKSVTIDCTGHTAISDHIALNAPVIAVKLRGLVIEDPNRLRPLGVYFQQGGVLFVENCTITGYDVPGAGGISAGIYYEANSPSRLYVTDTVISQNGNGGSGGGIVVFPQGSGVAFVWLNRVTMNQNVYGVFAQGLNTSGPIIVDMRDSAINGSSLHGIYALTDSSQAAVILDRTMVSLNVGSGIRAEGPAAFVQLGSSTVRGNGTGLSVAGGGQILSFQNNQVAGNATDGAPTGVLTLK